MQLFANVYRLCILVARDCFDVYFVGFIFIADISFFSNQRGLLLSTVLYFKKEAFMSWKHIQYTL